VETRGCTGIAPGRAQEVIPPPMAFEIFDVVRIERLLEPERDVDGSVETPPQPRVGELGTVVEALGDDVYLVERATDDGLTMWVAEFLDSELSLVRRPIR
jgi:hypothetical protein